MADAPGMDAQGLDRLLGSLSGILALEDASVALEQGAALVLSVTRATHCFLLAGESDRSLRGGWAPKSPDLSAAERDEFVECAERALQAPRAAAVAELASVQLVVSPPSATFRVVLCLDGPRLGDAERIRLERLAGLFACKVHGLIESERARGLKGRYERWFKRLDDQIKTLDRERQKFSAMVGRTDGFVFVTDLDRTIRWANPALALQPPIEHGVSQWPGQSCRALCRRWTEDRDGTSCEICPIAKAIETREIAHGEYHPPDGEGSNTLYLTALPISGPDGTPYEIMVTVQDLSDLDVLRKSESRYRALFERSSDALLIVDPHTHLILFANAAAGHLFACPESDMQGMPLRELHAPSEWARLEQHYSALFADAAASDGFEATVRTSRGELRAGKLRASRIDLEGRPASLLQVRDVTESQRVRHALAVAEERLRMVVANSPVVLFALDADGVFTLSEGKGLQALGLAPGEIVGRSVFEVYKDVPQIVENIRRALGGEEYTEVVTVGTLAFETRYTPMRDASQAVVGLIGVSTDVSERRTLEDRLRQSQKLEAVGRLAGGVAHDFNNLLTAILGACDLILRQAEPGSSARRHAEDIQSAGMRGAVLTRQLLSFGRRDVVAPRVLDANQAVLNLLAMLHRLVGEDVDLVTRVSSDAACVRADQGQLEQVLMNLVVNARDAMPGGGRLTIETQRIELDEAYCRSHGDARAGPHVLIAVSDEGCGMDPEIQSRIFEPFFTTKERGRGTGLGLSTVYGIVRQWGGHLGVYSERGGGSVFKVYLPESAEAVESEAPVPVASKLPRGDETILLAEDEETVRAVAREFLELQGYTVLEATDGADALAVAQEYAGAIDLLLTDVVMPRMGGGELVTQLTKTRPEMRVLYMSGYPDDAVVRHGLVDDRAEFLPKPFTLPHLGTRVRDVLEGPWRGRHAREARPAA